MSKTVPKFALAVGFVLAMAFTFSCDSDSSAFVGKWVRDDGSESMELFKDGTGVTQEKKDDMSMSITWKLVENKRFVMTATALGFLVSEAYNYEISGKKLTLTNDKGEKKTYVKPQEEKIERKIEEKTLTDKRDGKKYKTVIIGERTWMAENLNYEAKGSVCYDNNPENCNKYGRLYDWNTAKEACPSGWHLPSDEEWKIEGYVGGDAGKKLKSKGGWNNDGNGTDDFGFSALPGGSYSYGSFSNVGYRGDWWSATEDHASIAYYRTMGYDDSKVGRGNSEKSSLHSVRCLQD